MLKKKILAMLTSLTLTASSFGLAGAAVPNTVNEKLALIESDTYGSEQTGALLERLNKLEADYDGTHRRGSMMARVDAIYSEIYSNDVAPSLLAQLNAIEWNLDHEVSMKAVEDRLTDMEMAIQGKTGEGTYRERIAFLAENSFGETELPLQQTEVPANTLIKIALVTPINAKNLKVGDVIKYKVTRDVMIDGVLVFAKGEPGEGKVTKVSQARNFGRNAEVNVEFERTKSIDGTEVSTFVGEEAKTEMKNMAYAAGASLAGMALLGPIGIIGGAFVNGKNVDLPEGTEVYIQTKNQEVLYGVPTSLTAE
ncbi:MAG: hypothetical protein IJ849_03575 [Selenomonadaceae bacterium]|nr:hypothetical protein [Selenomonadaceae bacterium]